MTLLSDRGYYYRVFLEMYYTSDCFFNEKYERNNNVIQDNILKRLFKYATEYVFSF